jgi:transglutaminase-like putative cysteine protease
MELPDGLLPRVVLDSDRIEVLMARGDAREDATMRRLVGRAEREIGLLLGEELDRIAARPPLIRWIERVGYAAGGARKILGIGALLTVAAVTMIAGLWWMDIPRTDTAAVVESANLDSPKDQSAALISTDPLRPYLDLAKTYRGPTIDSLADAPRIDLSYRPVNAEPLFSALRVGALEPDGSPRLGPLSSDPQPYQGQSCTDGCLEVELRFNAEPGLMRVPVASGHRIDPATASLDEQPVPLFVTESGEPVIRLEAKRSGVLRYMSGPAPALIPDAGTAWPDLPEPVLEDILRIADLAPVARVTAATDLVRSRVSYDRSTGAAADLEEAMGGSEGLFAAVIGVGAGDCDVQNAILAAILDRTGIPAWRAVGMVGSEGRARPGLHAWVEYVQDGWWQVADASATWQVLGDEPWGPQPTPSAPNNPPVDLSQEVRQEAVAGTGLSRLLPLLALVVVLVALLGTVAALFLRWRRAPRRVVISDGSADLARLLRGALLRPRAYRGIGALFSRPLIPLIGGRRISLPSAVERARDGRLFRGSVESEPVQLAIRSGEAVIDIDRAEGAAVADLLGARDLDVWVGVADRAQDNPATEIAEAVLRRLGIRWQIRVADDPPQPVAMIEGHLLGLRGRTRVAIVDAAGPLWAAASRDVADYPAWTAFVLADGIANALDLQPDQRRRWLSALAKEAVVESSGGTT